MCSTIANLEPSYCGRRNLTITMLNLFKDTCTIKSTITIYTLNIEFDTNVS